MKTEQFTSYTYFFIHIMYLLPIIDTQFYGYKISGTKKFNLKEYN